MLDLDAVNGSDLNLRYYWNTLQQILPKSSDDRS